MIALFNSLRGQQHTSTSPGVCNVVCIISALSLSDSQMQSLHNHMKLKSPKRRQQRGTVAATKQLETMALSQRLSTTSLTTSGAAGSGSNV